MYSFEIPINQVNLTIWYKVVLPSSPIYIESKEINHAVSFIVGNLQKIESLKNPSVNKQGFENVFSKSRPA